MKPHPLALLGILLLGLFGACSSTSPEYSVLGQQVVGDCTVTLSAAPTAPQAVGTSITLTSSASCINGTPEYKLYLRNPSGTWSVLRDWDASTTFSWDTAGSNAGTYLIQAWTRRQGQNLAYEGASSSLSYELTGGSGNCSLATLTSSPASPQAQHTSITHTFAATCSSGATPEYKLYHRNTSGIWRIKQDWTTNTSFAWDTSTESVGNHVFQLWVRAQGSTALYQAVSPSQTFELTAANYNCSAASLTLSPASPQPAETPISLTFASTCTAGTTPDYKLYHRNPSGIWSIKHDWGASNSQTWNTDSETVGTHTFQLWVRAKGSNDAYQAVSPAQTFELTAAIPGSCTSAIVTASPTSPQEVTTPITLSLTGNCTGGKTPEYRVYHKLPSGTWRMERDWSTDSSYTWSTTNEPEGTHILQLWIRAVGSTESSEGVSNQLSYTLTPSTNPTWVREIQHATPQNVPTSYPEQIASDTSGNLYIVGSFEQSLTFGATILTDTDFGGYIAKFDSYGNRMWAKHVGSTGTDSVKTVITDNSGNAYIAGRFTGTLTLGTTTLTSSNSSLFVAKIDTNGTWQWLISLNGGSSSLTSITQGPSNYIYITGTFSSSITEGNTTLNASNGALLIGKLNTSGTWQWIKQGGHDNSPSAFQVLTDSTSATYVSGSLQGKTGTFGTTTLSNTKQFLAKMDSNGNWIWAKAIDGLARFAIDGSDNLYVTGKFSSQQTFGSTNLLPQGNTDLFVAKLDASGNYQWAKSSGNQGASVDAYSITLNNSGTIYILGTLIGTVTIASNTITSQGMYQTSDNHLTKINSSGVWQSTQKLHANIHAFRLTHNSGILSIAGHYRNTATIGTLALPTTTEVQTFAARFPAP